ncbi:phosphatase PAP2 family protein [Aquipuribacter sp. MA13-6]|uniref:phosphatase PAP2 family protein n=1 Tax=unclassified Aquipuribacter TaxID=2635084 RepID=UPI003EEB859F
MSPDPGTSARTDPGTTARTDPGTTARTGGGSTAAGTYGRLRGSRARFTGVVVLLLLFLPCLVASLVLFWMESTGSGLVAHDQGVLERVSQARTPTLDTVVTIYSDLGDPAPAIIATGLAVAGLGLRWRSWTPVVLMFLGGAGSLAMSMSTKAYADRVRPPLDLAVTPLEPSWSFPSGHALNATIIAGVLAYLVVSRTRSWRVAALVVPLAALHMVLMGLSRVYLGAHWLTDVIVGWTMALAWLALVLAVHQLLLRRSERTAQSP